MASPEQERMDALTEAIVRLLRRQDESDRRLAQIEAILNVAKPDPAPPPFVAAAPVPDLEPPPPPAVEPLPAAAPAPRFETRMGLTWINRIGALTLVLGAAFFFKYAVDNQWIGPAGRVLIGVLAGFALLALGDRLWRTGQQIYAQGIAAASVAVLYLTFYAAFDFYHLVPRPVAFLLMLVTTATTVALALRYNAQAMALLGLAGGYATPLLLSTGEDLPWFFFSFILLLDAAAVALNRARFWTKLIASSYAATVGLFAIWWIDRFSPDKRLVATVFALAFYTLFAAAGPRWVLFASQLLASLALVAAWTAPSTVFLVLAFFLAAAGLAIGAYRRIPSAATIVSAAYWIAYGLWFSDLSWRETWPTPAIFGLITAAFLLLLGWTVHQLSQPDATDWAALVLPALNSGIYFAFSYYLLEHGYAGWRGLLAVALAGLYLAVAFLFRGAPSSRSTLLFLGIALSFLTLAIPIQFSSYRITMGWTVEAAAIAWIGVRAAESRLRYVALIVFSFVLYRLFTIDSWMYPSPDSYTALWNTRFFTFLLAALCLWAAAWWTRPAWTALAPYVSGHAVLLWILAVEVIDWAARSTAENVVSAQSTSVSVLFALYAVLLVSLGVAQRFNVNRILGLGLIAFVVGKLYVYDVWLLARTYRIVAFSALGALLLLTSYLYSRYRSRIETWWAR